MIKVYIISYPGERGTDVRTQRIQFHNDQVERWLAYSPHAEVNILAMEYDDVDFIQNPRVHYVDKLDTKLPISVARNTLLNHFYDGDDEWGIFCDNDGYIHLHEKFPHTHIDILNILEKYPNNFEGIDLFFPHWAGRPGDGAFYDLYANTKSKEEITDWDNELLFEWNYARMKGTVFFLRNHNERTQMSTEFNIDGATIPGEDDEFALHMSLQNKGVYILRNLQLGEFNVPSTHHQGQQNERLVQMAKGDDITKRIHNIPFDRDKWKKWMTGTKHITKKKYIKIPYTKDKTNNSLFEGL